MSAAPEAGGLSAPEMPPPNAAGFYILRHFLVDLSVENPFGRIPDAAVAELSLLQESAASATPLAEAGSYGVNAHQRLTASVGSQVVFLAELNYRIDVRLHGVAPENVDEVLQVEVPEAVAPVLRAILQQNGAFAGYPDMQLGSLGFADAYAMRQAAA